MQNVNAIPHCLACGHQDLTTLFPVKAYRVLKCVQCGLVQTDPIVTQEDINAWYDQTYFESLLQRKPQEIVYHRRMLDLIERVKTTGKMLEVGIGIGIFMELAHDHGWDIEGIDPAQAACQYVTDTLHLTTYHSSLESMQLPQNHFDVISLRHVLEHIPTPRPFLQKLHRLVKDDGLVAIAVPNFGGLHARIEKAQWFHLSIPYHVAHYTPKTLTSLLTACHFEIIKLWTLDLSCSSYLLEILNLLLRLLKREPVKFYVSPQETDPTKGFSHWIVAKEAILNGLMARLGLGEEIMVIARKNPLS
jgi:2-polyprenyl-3-methyl-5-hydroxy-6-metoxy-1,4-benzoquinol methylase